MREGHDDKDDTKIRNLGKILRRIFGVKQTEQGRERRRTDKLYKLYNDTDVISFIKIKSLQWVGPLE